MANYFDDDVSKGQEDTSQGTGMYSLQSKGEGETIRGTPMLKSNHWQNNILKFILIIAFGLIGCQVPQISPIPSNTSTVVWQTIKSTDWIASLFLIGFVLSLVGVGLGMTKLGVTCSLACVLGLFLKAAMSTIWFYTGATCILLTSILIVVAGILYKRKAIVELILGAQKLKETPDTVIDAKFNGDAGAILRSEQSSTTSSLVNQIKATLKTAGKL